jgi:SAM-dependent methyltransferase
VLWEAGKLGDPNLVYGNAHQRYFRELLNHTSLTEEQLQFMNILEVGYGHGRLLHELQQRSPTAYGLDLAKPLKSARLRPGSAIFGNLLNIPFMPEQFELVVCRGVLHVTPDPPKSLACLAEQVANRGVLYLAGLYEPGKGNLRLRQVFPRVWTYPESVRLGLASVFSVFRAAVEAVRTRNLTFGEFRRSYRHYKLDIFDVLAPQWTSVHRENEVVGWFAKLGFVAKKVGYGTYVGVKVASLQKRSTDQTTFPPVLRAA